MFLVWQSKGRTCQRSSLQCYHLKVQQTEPQPLLCPYACLPVTSPLLFQSECPLPSSRLLSPTVTRSEPLPLWWPKLLVREELPGRQSQDRPLMRTPVLASTSDTQQSLLKSLGFTFTHPSTRIMHAYSIIKGGWSRFTVQKNSLNVHYLPLMILTKAFEFCFCLVLKMRWSSATPKKKMSKKTSDKKSP